MTVFLVLAAALGLVAAGIAVLRARPGPAAATRLSAARREPREHRTGPREI